MFVICGTQHWRAEMPQAWCAQHGRETVAIYHPDGVGALQISGFRKHGGGVSEADLREMAAGATADGDGLLSDQAGDFAGLRWEGVAGSTYWVRWYLARGAVALHVTYNCSPQERDREREVIERVVASLTCPLPRALDES